MEVKTMQDCKKRVVVKLKSGEMLFTNWYEDNSEKMEQRINCTEKSFDEKNVLLKNTELKDEDVLVWYTQRFKDGKDILITDHAFKRLKERNGWSKKSSLRMVKRVFEEGKTLSKLNGALRKWVAYKKSNDPSHEFIVYGEKLYVFQTTTLITVINIPKDLNRRMKND